MISHDTMISAKVALLERVTKDLLAAHFLSNENPTAALQRYGGIRTAIDPGVATDPTGEEVFDAVWSEFLDGVAALMAQERSG